ncbi:hypothetical protein SEA_PUREGLOBE5_5 [Arthrobacter phage Pureglobe5]|nr:membrane protein [Arthrobacter phage Beagle]QOP66756.1 membrane protein [Arthrobacter phage Odyssey395]UYL87368.1 hypothetical protein SEA_PUREGLOBE5_5 [Arthrobacter phage Pureglobe5]
MRNPYTVPLVILGILAVAYVAFTVAYIIGKL